MHIISFLIEYVLHLNQHLTTLTAQYGYWIYGLLFTIIFCQTGLVITAILPGDSLLFAAGAVASTGALNIYILMILLISAAFLGNTVNYWVGNKVGHLLFTKEKSWLFNKAYLDKTHAFYEKHGGKTIIIALFMPIIRTFAPFVAGMGDMNHGRFMVYNIIGVCLWVIGVLTASYLFGNIPFVQKNFSLIILVIIIVSVLPPGIEYIYHRYKKACVRIS